MVSKLAISRIEDFQAAPVLSESMDIKPILCALGEQFSLNGDQPFDNVLIVAMQHMLATTVDMLEVMYDMGLRDVVIGGKSYSTHQSSVESIKQLGYEYVEDGGQIGYGRFDECMRERVHTIWHRALERIREKKYRLVIVLDDGGDLLRATPGVFFKSRSQKEHVRAGMLVGIEQTRGGSNHPLFHGLPFPIINVAGSFIKAKTEYQWVSDKAAKQMLDYIRDEVEPAIGRQPRIGVVGYGTMGQEIAKRFTERGYRVMVYEKNPQRREYAGLAVHYQNPTVLMSNSDVIIGCTGTDITELEANLDAILYSQTKKWLVSTTSKDREFNSLLRTIQNEIKRMGYMPDPLETIRYDNAVGETVTILRGGFPINFDNTEHSVSPDKIWPTRAALMLACLTAADTSVDVKRKVDIYMLPRQAQLIILRQYLKLNPNDRVLSPLVHLSSEEILELINECSEGAPLEVFNGRLEKLHKEYSGI
jgi:S-adenosylhomocysteine hydrolase